MSIDVTVLRVFTDAAGDFGNPLGVVDATAVPAPDRQRLAALLGYSETVFIELPGPGQSSARAHIYTPAVELPFAGHPSVGAAWWLRFRGLPVRTIQLPAGIITVAYEAGPDADLTEVSARAEWAPEFLIEEVSSVEELAARSPDEVIDDVGHYLWTWIDRGAGTIRSRDFAPHLGIPEDEATGSAAVKMTEVLSRDLMITQGCGSHIQTRWNPDGWVQLAGRVCHDGIRQVDLN